MAPDDYRSFSQKELLIQLMDRFDRLDHKLDDHLTHAAMMDAQHEALTRQVTNHHRALNGNGRPGLVRQVESTRTTMRVVGSLLFLATAASPFIVWLLSGGA